MVSNLNALAELVELDALPQWLRKELESKKDEILQKLQGGEPFVFEGPKGEKITIRPKARIATAP
jgi:hypothetical protein